MCRIENCIFPLFSEGHILEVAIYSVQIEYIRSNKEPIDIPKWFQ